MVDPTSSLLSTMMQMQHVNDESEDENLQEIKMDELGE